MHISHKLTFATAICQPSRWRQNGSRKCCLVAELRLGSLVFCPETDLLMFTNDVSLDVNNIFSGKSFLYKAIYSRAARQRECFGFKILLLPVSWLRKDIVSLTASPWEADSFSVPAPKKKWYESKWARLTEVSIEKWIMCYITIYSSLISNYSSSSASFISDRLKFN